MINQISHHELIMVFAFVYEFTIILITLTPTPHPPHPKKRNLKKKTKKPENKTKKQILRGDNKERNQTNSWMDAFLNEHAIDSLIYIICVV